MIKQNLLTLKMGISKRILTRSGLSLYSVFMRVYGIKGLIDRVMPKPCSNRGYDAWQYIEPKVLMLLGGGKHIEEIREIIQDEGLRKLTGLKEIPSSSTVGDWLRRQGNTKGLSLLTLF